MAINLLFSSSRSGEELKKSLSQMMEFIDQMSTE